MQLSSNLLDSVNFTHSFYPDYNSLLSHNTVFLCLWERKWITSLLFICTIDSCAVHNDNLYVRINVTLSIHNNVQQSIKILLEIYHFIKNDFLLIDYASWPCDNTSATYRYPQSDSFDNIYDFHRVIRQTFWAVLSFVNHSVPPFEFIDKTWVSSAEMAI